MLTKSKKLPLFLLIPVFAFFQAADSRGQDGSGGKPIRVTETLHNDGTKTVMKTDPDNHTAESTNYNHANKLLQKTVFTLDDQGQAISGLVYSGKNVVLYKLIYKRDSTNRVNEVDAYSTADVLISRNVYRFDAQGRVQSVLTYDGNGNLIKNDIAPGTSSKKRGATQNH